MAYKGKFHPKNIEKYKGNHTNIQYRSSWELRFFKVLDENPDVISWSSEEIIVPYKSPIDGKIHRYYPDVVVTKQTPTGIQTLMIEIKPHKQTLPPDIKNKNNTKSGRISRRYLNEVKTFGVNDAKWKYAREYCKDRGWEFLIFSEQELGIK